MQPQRGAHDATQDGICDRLLGEALRLLAEQNHDGFYKGVQEGSTFLEFSLCIYIYIYTHTYINIL